MHDTEMQPPSISKETAFKKAKSYRCFKIFMGKSRTPKIGYHKPGTSP
jgi:hypothetical protein